MIQEMKMSRPSRLIINELNKLANQSNVQGFLVPAHIYMCDYMIIKYNYVVILNTIRSHINNIQKTNRQYKHFTPIYWYKVIDNIFKNNNNVRFNINNIVYGEMNDYNSYNHIISKFLQSD